MKLQGKRALV